MLLLRFYRIFERYADETAVLRRPSRALEAQGARLGEITRIEVRRNRLHVEGWAEASRIGLSLGHATAWTAPELPRPGSAERGFSIDIPFVPGTPALVVERGTERFEIALPAFGPMVRFWARHRLWPGFALVLVSLAPAIWAWKRHGDLTARETVKERLNIVPRPDGAEMAARLFSDGPRPAPRHRAATLVMPVYNARELLMEALDRVERHTDLDWRLVLIEDASPDPEIRPLLRRWCADPARAERVTLIENESNLGFIGSVNRGFELARRWPDDPVVLLNTDALVPSNWLSRLLAPLDDDGVASVTPMSNDAEIFTAPAICRRHDLAPGLADRLDAAIARLDADALNAEGPTGVGFCMAMAPRFVAKLPGFDPVFGRGYAEENDWCQKAVALGGRHVAAPNLFVEHRGGQSFGSAEKLKLIERNLQELARRHPGYGAAVQEYIREDPLTTARLATGLAWAGLAQEAPVPVYLAHAMGGGAEHDLQRRIAAETKSGRSAVVLRVGLPRRFALELHAPQGITRGRTADEGLLADLLGLLPRRRVVYSCGVGARDAAALPDLLLRISGRGEAALPGGPQPVELMMHDFFPVSPSYTLLGGDGHYHGVPRGDGPLAEDKAHRYERPGGVVLPLAEWQARWGALIAAAERVVTFAGSGRDIVAAAYPEAADRIAVVPHDTHVLPPRIAPGGGENGPVIGVLGNIGYHKGAAVLRDLSRQMSRSETGRIVVIGQMDPAYPLTRPSRVHGSYELRDLPGLVARYGIECWLIPSVWPETFSFTTHETLATGLPVYAFDLGAQGEAVARAVAQGAPGGVLPLPRPGEMSKDLGRLARDIAARGRRVAS
ncbi:glycosyltransferase [Limimaricola pyoseonensis]|uniref:glycosyltransferase n=1 Tax=Limimaricola pyoseonensis TaxID=521013 RepID=UPI000B7E3841|nr:glycosyltransferase [Limimaricola pyoseonensis]